MNQQQSGLEEAREVLKQRWGAEVSQQIPSSVLHIHGSTPWADMRSHQTLVTLSALQKTKADITVVASSSGYFEQYAPMWRDFALHDPMPWYPAEQGWYHFKAERLLHYIPAHLGGLSNYAVFRKERILALWRKICKNPKSERLAVIDMANHPVSISQNFGELLSQAKTNERIGLVPCPYCSERKTVQERKQQLVAHWLKGSYGICIENWHGKCPMRRILFRLLDSSLAKVVRETGLCLTGRFSMRWFAKNLAAFGAGAILIKDYKQSSGALKAAAEVVTDPSQLLVGTRTICNKTIRDLEVMDLEELSELVDKHPMLSDGSEFVC